MPCFFHSEDSNDLTTFTHLFNYLMSLQEGKNDFKWTDRVFQKWQQQWMWMSPTGPTAAQSRRALNLKSGMQLPSAPGILWLVTVPSAGTTLWIFVSNVRPTRHQLLLKSVCLCGGSVTKFFISTASLRGSEPGRCVRWTIESGDSKRAQGLQHE